MARDLTKFNPRKAPKTEALLNQKLLSLDEIGQHLFHALNRGTMTKFGSTWDGDVVCAELVNDIAENVASRHEIKRLETRVGLRLKEIFGSDLQKARLAIHGQRKYVWKFPPLDESRAAFERWIGQRVTWDME